MGKKETFEFLRKYSAAVEDKITTHFCYHLLMVLRQQFPLCLCKQHEFRFHGAEQKGSSGLGSPPTTQEKS